MADTTRLLLLQYLSEFVGDWLSLTADDQPSGATTTTIKDANLANLTEDDDGIQGWIRIADSDSDADQDVRRIKASSGYTASSTTLTVNRAFTADPDAAITGSNGVKYELHTIDPTYKFNAIDRAIESLFSDLYVYRRDETLTVDNLLLNQDFETFSSGFSGWGNIGTPTVTVETNRVIHGTQAAKIVASGAVEGIEQNFFSSVNINELAGRTLHFAGWIWASVASAARLRVTFDGSTYTNGAYHAGESDWEGPGVTLVNAVVPTDATRMAVDCVVADGETAYFDAMHAYVGPPITRYTLPTSIRTLLGVSVQAEMSRPNGNYFPLSENVAPSAGQILRLTGMGALTLPTADTSTVEIDGEQVDLLVARAAEILSRTEWARTRDPFWKEKQQDASGEVARLLPRARMRRLAASKRFRWGQDADSSSRSLVLER
jgi:hypothetical protein